MVSLTNSFDIVANSIRLINGNSIDDITDIFLSKGEATSGIAGPIGLTGAVGARGADGPAGAAGGIGVTGAVGVVICD